MFLCQNLMPIVGKIAESSEYSEVKLCTTLQLSRVWFSAVKSASLMMSETRKYSQVRIWLGSNLRVICCLGVQLAGCLLPGSPTRGLFAPWESSSSAYGNMCQHQIEMPKRKRKALIFNDSVAEILPSSNGALTLRPCWVVHQVKFLNIVYAHPKYRKGLYATMLLVTFLLLWL